MSAECLIPCNTRSDLLIHITSHFFYEVTIILIISSHSDFVRVFEYASGSCARVLYQMLKCFSFSCLMKEEKVE